MKWTDEVHVQRTISARKEARQVSRGGEPHGKGQAHLAAVVAVSGALASLAFVEKEGLPRVQKIPVVGGWLSEQISRLRGWQRKMNGPQRRRSGGRPAARGPPMDQARSAAIERAEGQARPSAATDPGRPPRPHTPGSQPQASSSQPQASSSRPNKKKKKHRK